MTNRRDFTIEDKLEAIEDAIRLCSARDVVFRLILKDIARDIKARRPTAPGRARERLQRAIDKANESRTGLPGAGYQGRTLFALAETLISEWATVKLALEQLEQGKGS